MPRFYFHLATGDAYERDEIGSELNDANEAYLEAFETAQQISVDLIREHRNPMGCRFEVSDAQDRVLFTLPFAEILGRRPSRQELTEAAERGRLLAMALKDEVVAVRAEMQNLWVALKRI